MHPVITKLQHGLIVSCQADPGDPLYGVSHMVAMARAALVGGAVGIRANYPQDVAGIKEAIPLPLIGIYKKRYPGSDVYITPTLAEVRAIAAAGADILAVQLTHQARPDGLTNAEFLAAIRREFPSLLIMADISTLEEGLVAADLGADLVSTTMSGYTPYSAHLKGPDLGLVRELAARLTTPLVAEGRYSTPEECRMALEAGAHAVVVGTAITRPQTVTAWFVDGMRG
ncbi:MAG TPA: N-acetylmannosamine-6-phosphate 2-epimerase [Symbiobacteriaceae bacterium]|nr:N-acetylmannosamine-6-phosphate 2-epimerase [Symbiobacteriaceae bacterium]